MTKKKDAESVEADAIVRRIKESEIHKGKYYQVTYIDGIWADICWINQCAPMYQRLDKEKIENLIVVN